MKKVEVSLVLKVLATLIASILGVIGGTEAANAD